MENSGNPYGNKDSKQSTSLYFFSIARLLKKNSALHLIYSQCFLKEMNF